MCALVIIKAAGCVWGTAQVFWTTKGLWNKLYQAIATLTIHFVFSCNVLKRKNKKKGISSNQLFSVEIILADVHVVQTIQLTF